MIYIVIKYILHRDELAAKGYEFISAQVKLIPQTTTELTDETQLKNMNKLVDMLEDDDDVQNVYHNWEINEQSFKVKLYQWL